MRGSRCPCRRCSSGNADAHGRGSWCRRPSSTVPVSSRLAACWVLGFALASPSGASAQQQAFSETIIVVQGRDEGELASFETRHALNADDVTRLDAAAADEVIRSLPAVHVPLNSRGEAIAIMRNASERQVTVFYDGASLNVPWDNRLDLSLVPAALIGSVKSAAGPLAPHYGVNALGAISLFSGTHGGGSLAYGSGDLIRGDLALPLGPAILGGSYSSRDGQTLPDDADLPYSQDGTNLRTNTDREFGDIFGHVAGSIGGNDVSVTAFQVWGNKGIASESNVDSGARYWRYSDVGHTLVTGSVCSDLDLSTELSGTAWYQRFGQTINSFADDNYDVQDSRQVDQDSTWGLRQLLTHRSGNAVLVGSFNFLQSTHRQRDASFEDGLPPSVLPDALSYQQRNWSIGAELEYVFSPALRGEVGVGYDVVDYVETGDKPAVEDTRDWTGRAALLYDAGGGWTLRGAVGRKIRAATMRELFGESIGRFLVNEDLAPEEIVTAELGAEWTTQDGGLYVIPFIQDLKNTIDQRRVGSLRQRINLEGSTVRGVEAGGSWRLGQHVTFAGNATWTRVRRKNPDPGQLNRIAEKPSLLATVTAAYDDPSGFSSWIRLQHLGRAYSADDTGALVPLNRSTSIDLQLSYALPAFDRHAQIFMRADNLADELITPQLGLPGPGRTIWAGVKII